MRLLSYIVLAGWLLALGRTILNLLVVPKLRVREPRRSPLVSAIVPARDEEGSIERTVRALLAQTYRELEVIVVNDRSTDATGEILARIAREDPRLVIVNGEEPPPGWLGKPHALHLGSLRARGELLLFLDADIVYQPEAVGAAVAYFEESESALVTLFPRIEMRGFWEHVAMPNLAMMAFSVLPLWLTNRTRIRVFAVGGGPGNLVRRGDYDAAGGHEALKDAVIDDVALARLMRRSGRRTEAVRAEHLVSVRMYAGLREIVDGFTKNAFATFGRSYLVAVVLIVGSVVVHILPYVLAVTGDMVSIVTVGVISLLRVILFASLGYRLDNALFGNPLMVLLWLWIMIRSTWITGIRKQLIWRGRTYDAAKTRFGAD
ncbi:MAG TPA: glycosyltransferase family 2 protein [Thermoanaerobaculia bacterium]|nr:glycosyltransferase family 2 protein [Thermoanaerobaculia bacterium]